MLTLYIRSPASDGAMAILYSSYFRSKSSTVHSMDITTSTYSKRSNASESVIPIGAYSF